MKCTECNGRGETIYFVETERDENTVTVERRKGICRSCNGSGERPMTNADRIRAMSDEELAVFLANPCECSVSPTEDGYRECGNELCKQHLLEWLQQPTKERDKHERFWRIP